MVYRVPFASCDFCCCELEVSCVTDHVGVQDSGAKTADFDDDDGGGLVSNYQLH